MVCSLVRPRDDDADAAQKGLKLLQRSQLTHPRIRHLGFVQIQILKLLQRPQLSPYQYDTGEMPDDFKRAFQSARDEDARRYTDMSGLSNLASSRSK